MAKNRARSQTIGTIWNLQRLWPQSFFPPRGEGGRRPDEGRANPPLQYAHLHFPAPLGVITPKPRPLPLEGRGRTQRVSVSWCVRQMARSERTQPGNSLFFPLRLPYQGDVPD